MSRIVLASASPRRKELLEQIRLEFEICREKKSLLLVLWMGQC